MQQPLLAVFRYCTSPSLLAVMPPMDSRRKRSVSRTTSSTRSGDGLKVERAAFVYRSTCFTRV